jgi:hypothetical protein
MFVLRRVQMRREATIIQCMRVVGGALHFGNMGKFGKKKDVNAHMMCNKRLIKIVNYFY